MTDSLPDRMKRECAIVFLGASQSGRAPVLAGDDHPVHVECTCAVPTKGGAQTRFLHTYEREEKARKKTKTPAVPCQEKSDVMQRFYEIESSLNPARVRYIRE